jgi:DNA-binding NarL/FixJ family response regulator
MGVTLLEKAFMMRILIADDHEMVRNATRRILESRGGIECVEARDGKEAVEQALELKPDLIVLHISAVRRNCCGLSRGDVAQSHAADQVIGQYAGERHPRRGHVFLGIVIEH